MTSEAPWFQKWTIRVTPKKFGSNISVYKLFSADQQTVSWPPRYSAKHRLGSVANHTKFHSITRFPQRNQQDTNNEEIHTVADTQIKLVSGRRLVFLCLMNGTCLKDWLPYASLYCPLFAIRYGLTGGRRTHSSCLLSKMENECFTRKQELKSRCHVYEYDGLLPTSKSSGSDGNPQFRFPKRVTLVFIILL